MNKKQFIEAVKHIAKTHPQGFTLEYYKPNRLEYIIIGHVTPKKACEQKLRYAVAITNNTCSHEFEKNLLNNYVGVLYVGGWYDSEAKQYYLDEVVLMDNEISKAMDIAVSHHQKAIFDLWSLEEIPVNENLAFRYKGGYFKL